MPPFLQDAGTFHSRASPTAGQRAVPEVTVLPTMDGGWTKVKRKKNKKGGKENTIGNVSANKFHQKAKKGKERDPSPYDFGGDHTQNVRVHIPYFHVPMRQEGGSHE